jgi:hypothetical protein
MVAELPTLSFTMKTGKEFKIIDMQATSVYVFTNEDGVLYQLKRENHQSDIQSIHSTKHERMFEKKE